MPCSRFPGGGGLVVVSQHALLVTRPTPKGEVEGDLSGGCLLWGGVCSGECLLSVGRGVCSGRVPTPRACLFWGVPALGDVETPP